MSIENISSLEAFEILSESDNTLIIDVRTDKEWKAVGVPRLDNGKVIFLSWRILPDMSLNENFGDQLNISVADKNTNLLFLCRSGSRSLDAGNYAASIGYKNCYNIIDGFEGNGRELGWKNNNGHADLF